MNSKLDEYKNSVLLWAEGGESYNTISKKLLKQFGLKVGVSTIQRYIKTQREAPVDGDEAPVDGDDVEARVGALAYNFNMSELGKNRLGKVLRIFDMQLQFTIEKMEKHKEGLERYPNGYIKDFISLYSMIEGKGVLDKVEQDDKAPFSLKNFRFDGLSVEELNTFLGLLDKVEAGAESTALKLYDEKGEFYMKVDDVGELRDGDNNIVIPIPCGDGKMNFLVKIIGS